MSTTPMSTTTQVTQALAHEEADDPFSLAGLAFRSRLLLGTGGVPSMEALERAITASGTEIVTVAPLTTCPDWSSIRTVAVAVQRFVPVALPVRPATCTDVEGDALATVTSRAAVAVVTPTVSTATA